MTVLEALKQSVDQLNRVNIPISMIQQIGVPVQNAAGLIQASVDALEQGALQPPAEDAKAEEEEPGAEPEEGAEEDDERTDV